MPIISGSPPPTRECPSLSIVRAYENLDTVDYSTPPGSLPAIVTANDELSCAAERRTVSPFQQAAPAEDHGLPRVLE
jgi:hypothetical protein